MAKGKVKSKERKRKALELACSEEDVSNQSQSLHSQTTKYVPRFGNTAKKVRQSQDSSSVRSGGDIYTQSTGVRHSSDCEVISVSQPVSKGCYTGQVSSKVEEGNMVHKLCTQTICATTLASPVLSDTRSMNYCMPGLSLSQTSSPPLDTLDLESAKDTRQTAGQKCVLMSNHPTQHCTVEQPESKSMGHDPGSGSGPVKVYTEGFTNSDLSPNDETDHKNLELQTLIDFDENLNDRTGNRAKLSPYTTNNPFVVDSNKSPAEQLPFVNEPTSPVEQPLLVNEPPSPGEQPLLVNEPPSPGEQPLLVNEPPSPGEQPLLVNEPPSPGEQPLLVNGPPSPGEQPLLVNGPPSPGEQPLLINEPPSPGEQPLLINEPTDDATLPNSQELPEDDAHMESLYEDNSPWTKPPTNGSPQTTVVNDHLMALLSDEEVAMHEVLDLEAQGLDGSQTKHTTPAITPGSQQGNWEQGRCQSEKTNKTSFGNSQAAGPDGSEAVLKGLISEISSINQFIIRCKRELESARRQRNTWLKSNRHMHHT